MAFLQILIRRTSFEFEEEEGKPNADILQVDSRFVSLLRWLGEHHIHVQLSGKTQKKGMRFIKSGKLPLEAEQSFQQKMVSYSL